jgi:hypothetical protein
MVINAGVGLNVARHPRPHYARQAPPAPSEGGGMLAGTLFHLKFWARTGWLNPSQLTRLSRIRPRHATTGIRRLISVGLEGQRDDKA